MLFIHYKSSNLLLKIFLIICFLLPLIGLSVIIFSFMESNTIWIYGSIITGLGVLLIILNYLLAPRFIKKLIDPALGAKTKNDKRFMFMNIHFNREDFTREEFKEYKEHYKNFYKDITHKINFPFNSI